MQQAWPAAARRPALTLPPPVAHPLHLKHLAAVPTAVQGRGCRGGGHITWGFAFLEQDSGAPRSEQSGGKLQLTGMVGAAIRRQLAPVTLQATCRPLSLPYTPCIRA